MSKHREKVWCSDDIHRFGNMRDRKKLRVMQERMIYLERKADEVEPDSHAEHFALREYAALEWAIGMILKYADGGADDDLDHDEDGDESLDDLDDSSEDAGDRDGHGEE